MDRSLKELSSAAKGATHSISATMEAKPGMGVRANQAVRPQRNGQGSVTFARAGEKRDACTRHLPFLRGTDCGTLGADRTRVISPHPQRQADQNQRKGRKKNDNAFHLGSSSHVSS